MTKQEQIKEILNKLKQGEFCQPNCYGCCGDMYMDITCSIVVDNIIKELHNAGYRKTFTSDLSSNTQKAFKEGYEKGKADTLERVAKYLDTQGRYFGLGYRIKQHLSEIDELLQEY